MNRCAVLALFVAQAACGGTETGSDDTEAFEANRLDNNEDRTEGLAAWLLADFKVDGWFSAIFGALILAIVESFLHFLII